MKRWLAAGDINLAAFFNRLNLLHEDFSGLQRLLNREQEEITSRADCGVLILGPASRTDARPEPPSPPALLLLARLRGGVADDCC